MTKAAHHDQFDNGAHFAMSADEVAKSLSMSLTTMELLVKEGALPKPFPIPGHPRLIRWDPEDVRNAVRDWKEKANLSTDGDWGNVR